MKFNGKYLDRRSFLKGSGVAIALPFLDAMIPAFAKASTLAEKPKLAYLYFPNGVYKGSFLPTGTGANYTLPSLLASTSLANHTKDISFVTGLMNKWGTYAFGDGAGDHPRACSGYLTGARPNKSLSVVRSGISADVLLGNMTGVSPLQITAPGSGPENDGYNEAYSSNLSWISETVPAARFNTPKKVFTALFGSGNPNPTPVAGVTDRSILDFVNQEVKSLKTRLTPADKIKLDEYLTSIEQVQKQIGSVESGSQEACPAPGAPPSDNLDFQSLTKTNIDLVVLALQCNARSILTYYMDYELNHRAFTWLGIQDSHHVVSHYLDSTSYAEKLKKINQWYVEQFAYMVQRLKSTSDATGRLFDKSIVVFGSGIENGHDHGDYNLPLIYTGTGGGRVKVGQVVRAGSEIPLSNFHLTLLQKYGLTTNQFGDSTGTISGL